MFNTLLLRQFDVALELRDAIPRPSSFNAETMSIEAVIASANPVPRQDARGPFHEILDPAGLDIAASRGASVLDSHQQHGLGSVLGTLDNLRVEGDQVIGVIRFSTRPEIAPMIEDVRSGVIQHLSVGYTVDRWIEGQANGGTRTRTAAQWVIRECSFVSVAADRAAKTRSFRPVAVGERANINRQIRALALRAGVGLDVVNDLVDRQVSVPEAREEILFEMQVRGTTALRTPHNLQSMDNPEAHVRILSEALLTRITPSHTPSAAARPFIGLSIAEVARECLSRNGITVLGNSKPELIKRALHSTSDFPNVLLAVVDKTLRPSYESAPSGLRPLAREKTAQDFRLQYRVQLDSLSFQLLPVPETGEFKSDTMADLKASYQIATYGRIFGISRQALVNDDLGAFTDLSARLGQAAKAFEAQQLVNLLVANNGLGPTMDDGLTLFHASHGNLATAGAAPSMTTLSDARLKMRRQKSPTGGVIDVTPATCVCGPELETTFEQLLTQIRPVQTTDVNPFASLKLIVEPRFVDQYAWYVVADPARIEGLEFCYLAGTNGPQTESKAGFEVDGVQIKVRLDYGAAFIDHHGWFKNPGR
jgi:hypothetical protein